MILSYQIVKFGNEVNIVKNKISPDYNPLKEKYEYIHPSLWLINQQSKMGISESKMWIIQDKNQKFTDFVLYKR